MPAGLPLCPILARVPARLRHAFHLRCRVFWHRPNIPLRDGFKKSPRAVNFFSILLTLAVVTDGPRRWVIARLRQDGPPLQWAFPSPARKIGRNERCYCGSGRKFKHCHGN
ncbi:SEC-C metal-binding domain-containing protein [Burkholderia perseverans]|uniref:SEC-C metal-binding domain-containing protein n=1 Tax=Burkholderia perseverans TaxID=2615214 RepID=UPI003CC7E70D